jgi:hypothetical protein
MVGEHDDDATGIPTGAGVDPLIAHPKLATGQTGQIERPGDQTPWWFVPGLCAVALLMIGVLVVAADRRAAPLAAVPPVEVATSPVDVSTTVSAPVQPETTVAPPVVTTTTVDPRIDTLPPAGTVRFGGSDREILARCEEHLPFDPADTEFETSSYFFFDSSGISQFVDRISTADGERVEVMRGAGRSVDVDVIGDNGAFAAFFDGSRRFEVVVNPAADAEQNCGDRLVTNAPGQFSEPHTRIILDVCVDNLNDIGTTIAGVTSQGARFEILQAGGELAEIVFDPGDGDLMRTTAPAFVIRDQGILSASGVVSDGTNDLDITIDIGSTVGESDARACSPSDRL